MDTTATEMIEVEAETTAQALLDLLALRGVEYFFANSGTDFASICDAFAMREKLGKELPQPVLAPHEIPLMSMAHGYYLATGKPQVAMVHVGVGTANCLGSIINASKGRVPILFFAGRTSITEEGQPSSRSAFIHWGQESFDQAAAVREYVKWDYELSGTSCAGASHERCLERETPGCVKHGVRRPVIGGRLHVTQPDVVS